MRHAECDERSSGLSGCIVAFGASASLLWPSSRFCILENKNVATGKVINMDLLAWRFAGLDISGLGQVAPDANIDLPISGFVDLPMFGFADLMSWRLANLDKSRKTEYPLALFGVYATIDPSMILSFASSKGGVGKSTTCAALAAKLAQDGDRVLVLDLDLNQTVARWAKKADLPGLEAVAIAPDAFTKLFREKEGQFDHVLIDLAGTREATLLKAMARSDLVIIPAQASEPDLREALVIIDDIRDVIEAGAKGLQYRLLLTKLFPLPTRVTMFAHREIARHNMARFKTGLVERAQYREMFLTGKAPTVAEPRGKAAREISALSDEIDAVLGRSKSKKSRAA
jgi:chromosome partitioning protein